MKLVNPANKRKYKILVVGTGLAGAAAAASLGELGYNVEAFCYQDSPRRAHTIAAQGGINAAKNYPNDGDSIYRLFYDTIKGGRLPSREADVWRLSQVSNNIIDQCVAQGVPFARDYAGYLDNRSFGGAQVSRTFYARGQTGQQLLLGAYSALSRQIKAGTVKMFPRTEMLDLVVVDGEAKGITVRDLVTGEIRVHAGDAVVLATGGYVNVFYLSTNAMGCSVTANWEAAQEGRLLREPLLHADPSDLHPAGRRLPVEADPHVRVAAQRRPHLGPEEEGGLRQAGQPDRRGGSGLLPGAEVPDLREPRPPGHLLPRREGAVRRGTRRRSRRARRLPRFPPTPSSGSARTPIRERYGNLFEMYERITDENGYKVPMRIYPAPHYAMGGLWVDYNLMSNIPGLFVLGEANFSVHGANRLGASALMQGLADGYFVIPYTIANYLVQTKPGKVKADHAECRKSIEEVKGDDEEAPLHQGQADRLRIHPRAGQAHVEQRAGWRAARNPSPRRSRRSRRSARSSGRTSR